MPRLPSGPTLLAIAFSIPIVGIGIPLNLRTPLWCDVTLYDICAWNVMGGGVHYQDTFDTNLPGMVWMHCLVRSLLGWSIEAIRCVDLIVVGSIVALLSNFLRKSSVGLSGRIWFANAVALFYLYESEYIQCQRDTWMMLPLLLAITLQMRETPASNSRQFMIGFLIGLMVWIKPHSIVPAGAVYLWLVWRQPAGRKARDFLRIVLGVLTVGCLGGVWLIASGSLAPMLDVIRRWNPEYYEWTREEYLYRWTCFWFAQQPWSRLHATAIPLAFFAIAQTLRKRDEPLHRSTLAVLYLSWITQSVALQKSLDYVLAPGVILCLALLGSFVGRWIGLVVVWLMFSSIARQLNDTTMLGRELRNWSKQDNGSFVAMLPRHVVFERERLKLWPECVRFGCSDEVRDELPFFRHWHTVSAIHDQRMVVAYLATLDLQPGQLLCWNDATHPIYREVGLKPGLRYLHFHTALSFASKRAQIRSELMALSPRYIVGDIAMTRWYYDIPEKECEGEEPKLPEALAKGKVDVFPWNQRIVYHSGRYYVFEMVNPVLRLTFDE